MASSPGASCISDPNFAVICAFLERFAKSCGITYPTFKELQEMLENVEEVPQELVDLHIKLLRKARKTVFLEKWEKALIKFCHTYSSQDGWELERFGYKKARLEVKLRVLKMLLEGQFDLNNKFKTSVNTLESEELRSKPLGKDKFGRVYWLQFDPTFNIHVYREDLDEESWTLVAQDRESLVILLQQLCENDYPLDLNLLRVHNFDLQEETFDTGQNNISTPENLDYNEQNKNSSKISQVEQNIKNIPETEKLNVNDNLTQSSNIENSSKIYSCINEENKSKNILVSSESIGDKPLSDEKFCEMDDLGDVIEEPVMYIRGEGDGEDCMTGNPEREENSKNESQRLVTENCETEGVEGTSHSSSESISSPKLNLEKIKPTPKLWSIDTICGVNSSKEIEDKKNSENVENLDIKLKQKNFSSFSIDSVLEKKDLIGLSENKSFSQFPVGNSSDIFSECIQIKESDHNVNKSNSVIDNSMQCHSNSSVISYNNSKILPCVMISKTENLINKLQDSKIIMNEINSSFVVPPTDLKLKSLEQNINLQTIESSEINFIKCGQTSEERKIFQEVETKSIVVHEVKNGTEKKVQTVEKICEKENKGDENNDLENSKIMEINNASENDLKKNIILESEMLNETISEKNYEGKFKNKEENVVDEAESLKNKPFLLSSKMEKAIKPINVIEEKSKDNYKNQNELMAISIENPCNHKPIVMENIKKESYNFEICPKNLGFLQSKTLESEQSSRVNKSLKTGEIIEKNFLKESSDQLNLQNKTSLKEEAEEIEMKCKENISFKHKSEEKDETNVKSPLDVLSENITNTIEDEKKLLNLSNTQLFLEKSKIDKNFQLIEEEKTCVQLQENNKLTLNVNKIEEKKKLKNDECNEIEESEKIKTKKKEINNESLKCNENIVEKFELELKKEKGEKQLEGDLKLEKVVEDKMKESPVIEKKEELCVFNKKKKLDENKKIECTNEVKAEDGRTSFESNKTILLSKNYEIPYLFEAKQVDQILPEDKKGSLKNKEIVKTSEDINSEEKKIEDEKVNKKMEIKLYKKQEDKNLENLKSHQNECEKIIKACDSNEKLQKKSDVLKLIEYDIQISKIKIKESSCENDKLLSHECNIGTSKINLIEINESVKEGKHFEESETKPSQDLEIKEVKPSQMIIKSRDLCAQEREMSSKKLLSNDLNLDQHIIQESVSFKLRDDKDKSIEKDLKDEKHEKEEIIGNNEKDENMGKDEKEENMGKDEKNENMGKDEKDENIEKDLKDEIEENIGKDEKYEKEENMGKDEKYEKEENMGKDEKEEMVGRDEKEENIEKDLKEEIEENIEKDEKEENIGKNEKDQKEKSIEKDEKGENIEKNLKYEIEESIKKDLKVDREESIKKDLRDDKDEKEENIEKGEKNEKEKSLEKDEKDEKEKNVGKDLKDDKKESMGKDLKDDKEEIREKDLKDGKQENLGKDLKDEKEGVQRDLKNEKGEIIKKDLKNKNEEEVEKNLIGQKEEDLESGEIERETIEKLSEESYKITENEEKYEDAIENLNEFINEDSKEILNKSGRRKKKGNLPARILSRNRKTAAEEIKDFDCETTNNSKSETIFKSDLEKLEISNETSEDITKENEKLKDKEEADSENKCSLTENKSSEIQKSEVTPSARRGRKPRGRKKRKTFTLSSENKSTTEEVIKDKSKIGEDEKEMGVVKKKGRPKKEDDNQTIGRQTTSREIKLLGITNPNTELTSIRQSRRIAQIKMKEEAERRRLEALQLESFKNKKKTPKMGKRKSRKNADSDSYDEKDGANDGDSETEKTKQNKEKKSRKRKKKDKLVFNELNPWLSSSGSSSADEEEEEIEEEPHDDEELVFKSDHEFSPESDVEDPDYKPIKRARTAKVEESKEVDGKYDDTSCEKCNKNDHPEWILLCDKCDKGWHASCVRPALMVIPEGDWFCPPCEHESLILKLQESLKQFDRFQKQREIEEMRKKRLAFVGISLDNVLPLNKKSPKSQSEINENEEKKLSSGTDSDSEAESSEYDSDDSSEPVYQLRERRSNVTSYRYNEYDELIKSALQDEIEAVKGAGNAGKGKDINNIVNAEKQKQEEAEVEMKFKNESILTKTFEGNKEGLNDEKLKEKIKKEDDYEKDTDGDMVEEKEEVADEIPPVVPKDFSKKKKSKSLKITSLDFTSEEEDHNSDSDFKGASSEEESDYSLPSESESSDDHRKSRKSGPLRRSTRARTSRYDRDFINDDSDDSPKRKKIKREWDSSESSDSDRSWGRKKRKGNRSAFKSDVKLSRKKGKKKKHKRKTFDSDNEESLPSARPRNKKIKYGGLDSLDEQPVLSKRTRGKKINYQEMNGSDSEDEVKNQKSRPSRIIESDDDFVAENEKDEDDHEEESEEIESEVDEDEEEDSGKEEFLIKKKNNNKNKKPKKKGIISDSDDSDKNDEAKIQDHISKIIYDSKDLNKEKKENIENVIESNNTSNQDNDLAENEKLTQSTEEKETEDVTENEMIENKLQLLPSNAALSDYQGSIGKFPKIGKIKITPSRAELASHIAGMPSLSSTTEVKKSNVTQDSGENISENNMESESFANHSSTIKSNDSDVNPATNFLLRTLQNSQNPNLVGSNIPSNLTVNNSVIQTTKTSLPYTANSPAGAPLNVIALLNSQSQSVPGIDNASPIGTPLPSINSRPQFSPFQGVISAPLINTFPSKIPTTVTKISEIESQNQAKKKGSKSKKKPETSLLTSENGNDNSSTKNNVWPSPQGEEFSKMQGVQDSPPKKKGRGRGKKQLLAEAQAQAQAQALTRTQDKKEPSQFLPHTLPAEGGSVISRILNTRQSPSSFPRCDPNQFLGSPRIRPPFGSNLPPNFLTPTRPMPPLRQRPPAVGGTIFHTSHPLDPSPSGGSAINISVSNNELTKSSPSISSPFIRNPTLPGVTPRFPPDPNVRQLFTSRNSPPRPEFSPFSHYYGNFPPPGSSLSSSENSSFSNSTFSESFSESTQGSGSTANPKQFEDETGGEFGGLASYFASQREDDLET